MSTSLLGLPLDLALQELKDRGVDADSVTIRRLLAPRREARCDEQSGNWRVVRVVEGEPFLLDVCCFERVVE